MSFDSSPNSNLLPDWISNLRDSSEGEYSLAPQWMRRSDGSTDFQAPPRSTARYSYNDVLEHDNEGLTDSLASDPNLHTICGDYADVMDWSES